MVFDLFPYSDRRFIAASMMFVRNVPDETVTILLIIRLLNGRSSDYIYKAKILTELISASSIATLSLLKKYIPRTRHSLISNGNTCLPNFLQYTTFGSQVNLTLNVFPFFVTLAVQHWIVLRPKRAKLFFSNFSILKTRKVEASFISDKSALNSTFSCGRFRNQPCRW